MSRYLQRASRVLAIMIVVAFATYGLPAALVGEPVAENAAAEEMLVKCGWLSDILVWNPLNLEMVEDWVACFLIYSALITYDNDWNMLENDLARDWSIETMDNGTAGDPSDDYLIASVEITQNAYWRNAADPLSTEHKVTAHDVKYTYDTIIEEDAGAFPLYLKGIREVRVIDNYNLEIESSYIKATLMDDLSGIPIVPKYIFSNYSSPCTKTLKPDMLVGCGPFIFDDMLSASWWRFLKAENYHMTTDYGETCDIDFDGITFSMHGSAIELAYAMNAGEEDCIVMTGEPNLYLNVLEETATVRKAAVRENGICDVAINAIPLENRTTTYGTGFELLMDPILREAILMCMDKDAIQTDITWDLAQQANSVVQPGYWHIDPVPEIPFDPAGAKALLMANGYADEDSNGYLECRVTDTTDWRNDYYGEELEGIRCDAPNTDNSYYQVAQLWESNAKDAGIGLVASQKSEGVMVSAAWYKADYDIWVWHWGWGPEPLSTLSCWLTETMKAGGDNCQMPMGPYEDYVNEELNLDLTYTYDGSIYDQVWYLAGKTVDLEERKALIGLLQQWVYDSKCEYPPYYDVGLYSYSTATFTNWGDWSLHNGQNFVSGLPWLWFDLELAANTPPKANIGLDESYECLVNEEQIFTIEVMDPQGDKIWANWSFGDGGTATNISVTDTSETPATFTQVHTYDTLAADLVLSVTLTDGIVGHMVTLSAQVDVVDIPNLVPVISAVSSNPSSIQYVGEEVAWTATFTDAEDTSLKVTWDWDDGTYTVTTLTPSTVGAPVTDTPTHTWSGVGVYDVIVSVWDGKYEEDGSHNQSTGDTDHRMEIIENTPPVAPVIAAITGNAESWTPCQAVTSDYDADIITVTWEWDDGTFNVTSYDTSSAQGDQIVDRVKHLWDSEGSYPVTVWADDGMGLGHNVSTEVIAVINPADTQSPPSGLSVVADPDPPRIGTTTALTVGAYDVNGDAIAFTVDFGDDSDLAYDATSEGSYEVQEVVINHVYTTAGPVTVTLYADDGSVDGNVSATFALDVADNSPPELGLQTSYSAYYNQTFTITPSSVQDDDGDELTVWYDWGDDSAKTMGDPDNDYSASHIYSAVTTYTITASVDDGTDIDGHNVSETVEVTVSEANFRPTATVVKEPLKNEYAIDEEIHFNVTTKDIEGDAITVIVNFGDGSANVTRTLDAAGAGVNTTTSFSHSYTKAGDYTVTVTIKDDFEHSKPWNFKTVGVTIAYEETGGNSLLLYAAVGLLLIIVIVAALMLMKRKKKGASDAGGMEGMMAPEESPSAPPPPEEPS